MSSAQCERMQDQFEKQKRFCEKLTEILCVTKIFEGHPLSPTVKEVDEELYRKGQSGSSWEKNNEKVSKLTPSHLYTTSTSFSLSGLISVGRSLRGGTRRPSIVVKISFHNLNETRCQAVLPKLVSPRNSE